MTPSPHGIVTGEDIRRLARSNLERVRFQTAEIAAGRGDEYKPVRWRDRRGTRPAPFNRNRT